MAEFKFVYIFWEKYLAIGDSTLGTGKGWKKPNTTLVFLVVTGYLVLGKYIFAASGSGKGKGCFFSTFSRIFSFRNIVTGNQEMYEIGIWAIVGSDTLAATLEDNNTCLTN